MRDRRGVQQGLWAMLAIVWLAGLLISAGAPVVYAQDGGDPPVVVDDPGQVDDEGEPTAIALQALDVTGGGMFPAALLVAGLALAGVTLFAWARRTGRSSTSHRS